MPIAICTHARLRRFSDSMRMRVRFRAGFGARQAVWLRQIASAAVFAMHVRVIAAIQKRYYITMTCVEILPRAACYLCNTIQKRG